jgi:pectate lyase
MRYRKNSELIISFMIMATFLMLAALAEDVPDSLFQMNGYPTIGEGTTGGAGGTTDAITNLADLEAWAKTREKPPIPNPQ